MPLDPQRVQAVFLAAASYHDPVDRAAVLDHECLADTELRLRVEALLRAHDQYDQFVNQPPDDDAGRDRPWLE
jgi:eukaryotic-like serine/threonine-protein kinase